MVMGPCLGLGMVRRSRSNQPWAQLTTHRPNPLFLARPTQASISTRKGRLIIVWGLAAHDVTARTPILLMLSARTQSPVIFPNRAPYLCILRVGPARRIASPSHGLSPYALQLGPLHRLPPLRVVEAPRSNKIPSQSSNTFIGCDPHHASSPLFNRPSPGLLIGHNFG